MSLIEYNGESKVIKRICELLDTMSGINFEVVQTLPLVDISTSTIYLVPKQTAEVDNIYDEYINTDGTSQGWELIGTTEIDLTNYVQFSDLSTVATSGDYDDLIDKPTIPTVNNGTLTIQLNGTTEQTFTANSSSNKTANIKAVDWKSNGEIGAKNFNLYPYNQSTRTDNGVTFTVNEDGSITTSGTASATTNAVFLCHSRTKGTAQELIIKNGKYILSGCPSGGALNKYYIGCGRTHNSAFESLAIDMGSEIEFTLNGDDYSNDEVVLQVAITIYRGNNADGLTFKPMLRLASDSDTTWQPYAKTNKELTQDDIKNTNRLGEISERSCLVGQGGNTSANPYFKIASMDMTGAANQDYVATFFVTDSIGTDNKCGILRVHIRTASDKTIDTSGRTKIEWLVNNGYDPDEFMLVFPSTASPTVELWTAIPYAYIGRRFTIVGEGRQNAAFLPFWTLYNNYGTGQANVTANTTVLYSTSNQNNFLKTQNLNDVFGVGFYTGINGNTCTNKPSGVGQFGLVVVRTATSGTGKYYKQALTKADGTEYVRYCVNNVWGNWTQL